MKKRKILQPGDRMHDLLILEVHHRDHRSRRFLLCRCICGNTKVIQGSLITAGNTKSCGCRVQRSAQKRRLPNNAGVINQIILGYRRHAKRRGLRWALSVSAVRRIIALSCHYCNSPPSNVKITKNHRQGFTYSGIDRVDSSVGYTEKNCVPCCKRCNKAKNDTPLEQFLIWVAAVYTHMAKKGDIKID